MRTPTLLLPICLAVAACGDSGDAVLASADGKWRVVHVTEAEWKEDRARAEMESALERLPRIDLVYAHNDDMAHGAVTAAQHKGRAGIRFVGIDALPKLGRQYLAQGQLDATIEYPTCAAGAIDLALLACNGVQLPRRIVVGTRVWTPANQAAGGAAVPSAGDIMLADLRAHHGAELTTRRRPRTRSSASAWPSAPTTSHGGRRCARTCWPGRSAIRRSSSTTAPPTTTPRSSAASCAISSRRATT
jgi:hypothetical protein